MKNIIKNNLVLIGAFLFGATLMVATTAGAVSYLFPQQGGTGTSATTTKGSLLVGSSTSAYAVLPVGANGLVLKASSSATYGVSWESVTSGSGALSTTTAPTAQYVPFWGNATGGLSGTSTLFISTAGFVGVGTTNPAQNFVVASSGQLSSFEVNIGSGVIFQSYNRGSSTYAGMTIDGSSITIRPQGSSTQQWAFGVGGATTTQNLSVGGFSGTSVTSTNGAFTTLKDVDGTKYSTSTGANPTASVGKAAVNGTANTFLRSDGAPALSAQFASSSVSFNIYDATSTAPYKFAKWQANRAITLSQVSCNEYAAATTTIQIYRVTSNSTTTNNSDLVTSIQCGINGTTTTTFASSSVAVDNFIFANVTSTAGTPTWTTVNVYYSVN